MCLLTMTNDGGLRAVLDTSHMVSQQLVLLSRTRNTVELAEKTIDDLDMKNVSVSYGPR